MKCPTCGAEVQPGQQFCPSCGAKQLADQAWGNPYTGAAAVENRNISKAEFCRSYALDKIRKNIRASAILCYVSAAVTAVFAIMFNPFMFLDVIIVLVLGLLIHLKQSRVCAVLLLAYSLFNAVVMLLSTGKFSGWLIILAGVFAVIYTFQAEKAYQEFRGGTGNIQ